MANQGPTPVGLNARNPDFAAFAVRIGRALGRETEAVAALRAAEADKSMFCLENDPIGAALLAHFRTPSARSGAGSATALFDELRTVDPDLNCLGKGPGEAAGSPVAHLEAVFDAKRSMGGHSKTIIYTLKPQ